MGIRNIGGTNMKIGVDAGCLGIQDKRLQVGVYHIVKNLLIELGRQDKKNEYILYSFYPIKKELMKQFGVRMKNVVTLSRGWLKIWLPFFLIKDKIDIFLGASQASPLRLPFFSKYKTIGIVYDIAYDKFPNLYSYAASVKKHSLQSQGVVKDSSKIVAISQNTKKDLVEIYKTDPQKILVAYPGLVGFPKTKPINTIHPYFLYVGALKKVKNVAVLLAAFKLFSRKSKQPYDLLLAGGDKWMDPDITNIFSTYDEKLKKRVKFLGAINNRKYLASLYKGAVAFVSPSLYEGFGLPFIEAMSNLCPVIGSTAGSVPEVVGKAGMLVDPKDISGLAKAMEKIATNQKTRQRFIKEGKKQVKKYSWKTFAKTVRFAIDAYE